MVLALGAITAAAAGPCTTVCYVDAATGNDANDGDTPATATKRKGDFFHESPGRTHTLVTDEGMETLFHLGTPIEFLDENDKIIQIVDVFWMIDHYQSYCEKHNLPINRAMFV